MLPNESPEKTPSTPKRIDKDSGASHGLSPFPRGPEPKFSWITARTLCNRLMAGEYLTDICQNLGISVSTLASWSDKKPKFAEWITRARKMQTENFMEKSLSMFDDPLPMEVIPSKNGHFERPSMAGVQNRIAKSRAMQIYASRWNPGQFGDRVQVDGSISLVAMLSKMTEKKLKRVKELPPELHPPASDV